MFIDYHFFFFFFTVKAFLVSAASSPDKSHEEWASMKSFCGLLMDLRNCGHAARKRKNRFRLVDDYFARSVKHGLSLSWS